MRRYIIKATNNFELETNELLEAQKVLANESTKNFNETFTVIRIDGNNKKILVQGKVIEPEEQKKLSDFIWNYKERVKVINTNKINDTINFKIEVSDFKDWDNGFYFGNIDLVDGEINSESEYKLWYQNYNGEVSFIGYRYYSLGDANIPEDCEKCFSRYTEGWDDEEISNLRDSLHANGQRVCGVGYSFGCPSDSSVDEQAGIYYDEIVELLEEAGIYKK